MNKIKNQRMKKRETSKTKTEILTVFFEKIFPSNQKNSIKMGIVQKSG